MPVALTSVLNDTSISTQEKQFLKNLQANVLKGHGREHVALVFLAIADVGRARGFLQRFPVSDAFTQLQETVEFKKSGKPGGPVRLVFVSHTGMTAFGHGTVFPNAAAFNGGMAADVQVLDDMTTASWQPELKKPVDVMLLLAHHDAAEFVHRVAQLKGQLELPANGFELVFVQEGRAQRNADGEGIEHFGYVDGRSQPLMLQTELDDEAKTVYNPSSPLEQFIFADPLDAAHGFGSFLVFRKLEQNVAGFKQAEAALAGAGALNLPDADEERAGAQIVGRFEDGTPVTSHDGETGVPVVNDFDHTGDTGGRCPMQGHIRKSNPRGASPGGPVFDKKVQMARRGITYGCRLQDPCTKEFIDSPNDGVGLLFMSYQASIEKQFHFMQTQWCNNENFPQAGVGVDPVIGQRGTLAQTWFPTYNSTAGGVQKLVQGFVTLKGGEYFYAPSVSGIRKL